MPTNRHQPFTHHDAEIIERTYAYDGFLKIAQYKLRYRLFKGGQSDVLTREVLERVPAVAILPYNPHNDTVVLIEQLRIGALSHPHKSPWLLEIVAGLIDTADSPAAVAKREAFEEAHCDVLDLHLIGEYFVSPGGSNEYVSLFCGRIGEATEGIFGLPEEHEDIRTHVVSFDQAYAWVEEGKICTVPAVLALQWLKINKMKMQALWQSNRST